MKKIIIVCVLVSSILSAKESLSIQIEEIAKQHLGGKYVWGGTSPYIGMDCSGFTQYIFKSVGINIPRTAYSQSKVGSYISDKKFKKGDLLFFLTDRERGIPITHVGIYLDNHKFIHAASKSKGIIISSLKGKYGKLFVKAKRVLSKEKREKLVTDIFDKAFERALYSPIKISYTSFSPKKI